MKRTLMAALLATLGFGHSKETPRVLRPPIVPAAPGFGGGLIAKRNPVVGLGVFPFGRRAQPGWREEARARRAAKLTYRRHRNARLARAA